MFISFEGGEGCGKSTQAILLKGYLENLGQKVLITREPGGGRLAEKIRNLLLADEGVSDAMTEFLLLNAARRDHVVNIINPALLKNEVVICDRFIDSSLVYQGYVKGLSLEKILEITKLSIGSLVPHLTILLDLPPECGMKRLSDNNREQNYYDKKDIDFHIKIREGYLSIAERFPNRIRVVDATKSQDAVLATIKEIIAGYMHLNNIR